MCVVLKTDVKHFQAELFYEKTTATYFESKQCKKVNAWLGKGDLFLWFLKGNWTPA